MRGGSGGGASRFGGGAGSLKGFDELVVGNVVVGIEGLELLFFGEGAGEVGGEFFERDFVDGLEEGEFVGLGEGGVGGEVLEDVGLVGGGAASGYGGQEGIVIVGQCLLLFGGVAFFVVVVAHVVGIVVDRC